MSASALMIEEEMVDAAEPMEEEVQPPHPREAARDRLREVCKKRGIELVG